MNKNYAVKFENVSKIYNVKNKNNKKNINEKFYALKDISFEIKKGESVGILGSNGSGKSTISKILAGITSPDEGKVEIDGEQALIAINSGLNNKLTGLENIELKGVLLGFSKSKIKKITESVIEFSELGDFIHQPVKNYSSGMKSRLGFSISINLNPDIIIVDEALSVGDKTFNEKCLNKINEMKSDGKTIFFVSHSLRELKSFCSKGLWIEGGVLKEYDDIDKVAKNYHEYVKEYKSKSDEEKKYHRELIYQSRIIKHNKSYRNKKIIKKIIPIVLSSILGVSALFVCGNKKIDAYLNKNKESTISKLEKSYNYAFIDTQAVDIEDDSYRSYLNKEKPVIENIIIAHFDKDGKSIEITKIPSNIQYSYQEKGIADELKYYYHIEEDNNKLLSYLKEITDIEVDEVFNFDNKKIGQAIEAVYNSNINETKAILNNLSKIVSVKTELNNIKTVFFNEEKYSYININYRELKNVERVKVGKLISIDKEITDFNALKNELFYIPGIVDLSNNIYVKASSREIEIDNEIDVEANQNQSIVEGYRPSNQNNGWNGNSNSSSNNNIDNNLNTEQPSIPNHDSNINDDSNTNIETDENSGIDNIEGDSNNENIESNLDNN